MKFLGIEGMLKYNPKKRKFGLNQLSFWQIFGIWFFIVLSFGLIYKFLQNDVSYLHSTITGLPVTNLLDTIYFSFVSATTTGFGDVVPFGFFKLIATIELILGLLILALVTSKLVSMKQEAIMDDLYEISFNDKLNNLRSSMLLFRQKINKARYVLEDGKFHARDLASVDSILVTFDDTLLDISKLLQRQKRTDFTKSLDSTNAELLFNSILSSFQRLKQFLEQLQESKVKYQDDVLVSQVKSLVSRLKILSRDMAKVDFKDYEAKTKDLVEWYEEFK